MKRNFNIKENEKNSIWLGFSVPNDSIVYHIWGHGKNFDYEYLSLLQIFGVTKKAIKGIKINIPTKKIMNDKIKLELENFVKYINSVEPSNKQSIKFLRFMMNIDEGTYFTILISDQPFTPIECLKSVVVALKLNKIKINKKLIKKQIRFYKLYTELSDPNKTKIGEPIKNKRVCRFCKKTENDGVSFKNRAHAISESLGNKKYILHEECDNCNAYFACTIEKDILEMFKIEKIAYGIAGKKNKPIYKFNNLVFDGNTEDHTMKIYSGDVVLTDKTIEYGKFVPQNVYKALVKYALSVISDKKELNLFDRTIEWICGNKIYQYLPDILIIKSKNEDVNIKVYKYKNRDYICHLNLKNFEILFQILQFPYQKVFPLNKYLKDALIVHRDNIRQIYRQNITEPREVIGTLTLDYSKLENRSINNSIKL